jgi:hypothetical protein
VTDTYRFDRIEPSPAGRQLLVDKQPAVPGAWAPDVLLALIESRDRLVAKNELLDLGWPGLVVEENKPAGADFHAAQTIRAVRGLPPPSSELVTPIPNVASQPMFDHSAMRGALAYEKSPFLDELSDAAVHDRRARVMQAIAALVRLHATVRAAR